MAQTPITVSINVEVGCSGSDFWFIQNTTPPPGRGCYIYKPLKQPLSQLADPLTKLPFLFPSASGLTQSWNGLKLGSLTSGSRGNISHKTQVFMTGQADQGSTIPSSTGGFMQNSWFSGTTIFMCILMLLTQKWWVALKYPLNRNHHPPPTPSFQQEEAKCVKLSLLWPACSFHSCHLPISHGVQWALKKPLRLRMYQQKVGD